MRENDGSRKTSIFYFLGKWMEKSLENLLKKLGEEKRVVMKEVHHRKLAHPELPTGERD